VKQSQQRRRGDAGRHVELRPQLPRRYSPEERHDDPKPCNFQPELLPLLPVVPSDTTLLLAVVVVDQPTVGERRADRADSRRTGRGQRGHPAGP
jgi:hypothetical protein